MVGLAPKLVGVHLPLERGDSPRPSPKVHLRLSPDMTLERAFPSMEGDHRSTTFGWAIVLARQCHRLIGHNVPGASEMSSCCDDSRAHSAVNSANSAWPPDLLPIVEVLQ